MVWESGNRVRVRQATGWRIQLPPPSCPFMPGEGERMFLLLAWVLLFSVFGQCLLLSVVQHSGFLPVDVKQALRAHEFSKTNARAAKRQPEPAAANRVRQCQRRFDIARAACYLHLHAILCMRLRLHLTPDLPVAGRCGSPFIFSNALLKKTKAVILRSRRRS